MWRLAHVGNRASLDDLHQIVSGRVGGEYLVAVAIPLLLEGGPIRGQWLLAHRVAAIPLDALLVELLAFGVGQSIPGVPVYGLFDHHLEGGVCPPERRGVQSVIPDAVGLHPLDVAMEISHRHSGAGGGIVIHRPEDRRQRSKHSVDGVGEEVRVFDQRVADRGIHRLQQSGGTAGEGYPHIAGPAPQQ
ncbi:Uncharacterised protein [Mycobacteroides abscessus subsp. abscessus]|nr:Uncharacterised protein [Mycobacteroides abscessus subsp. abscessus]